MLRSPNWVPMMPTITLTPAAQRSFANRELSTAGEPEAPVGADASNWPGVEKLPPNDTRIEGRWRVLFPLSAVIAAVVAGWWLFSNDGADHRGPAVFPKDASTVSGSKAGDGDALASARRDIENLASSALVASGEAARLREDALWTMQELQRTLAAGAQSKRLIGTRAGGDAR